MVGRKFRVMKKKAAAEWVRSLVGSEFFGLCVDHGDLRKNMFCIDCNLSFCKHCVISSAHNCSCLHRLLQICKYVYRDVVRLHDIQPYLDCSLIQAYKINGEKAVHLNPRPQQKDGKSTKTKGGGTCCEACGRHIQDLPNRFCSIACKISVDAILMSTERTTSNVNGIPSLETECESSYENGCASPLSLTDSSSEVIQAWWNSSLRPKKVVHKRKGFPRRSPLC
ncbi:hypothetical protein ACS0TY_011488 [Phlomoides rotata]